jgi:hypothetical protein
MEDSMTVRTHLSGRTLFGSGAEALSQQLWLNTWAAIHTDVIRPGWSVEAKSTIPPEEFALQDPPEPGGLIGRAEVNWDFHVETASQEAAALLYGEIATQLASTEVMGYGSADPE